MTINYMYVCVYMCVPHTYIHVQQLLLPPPPLLLAPVDTDPFFLFSFFFFFSFFELSDDWNRYGWPGGGQEPDLFALCLDEKKDKYCMRARNLQQ